MHSIVILLCAISCSEHSTQVDSTEDPLKSNEHDIVKIIAHKGFWRAAQSKPATNSIEALRSAQEYHLWGSEFDVQMTADSIPIVYHDDDIDGLTILKTPISSLINKKLPNGEGIPTLEQYLSVAAEDRNLVLVIELKWQRSKMRDYLLIDKCLELLKRYELLSPERVLFISFSTDICERLVQLLPGFAVQALFSNQSLEYVKSKGMKGIDYYQDIFLDDFTIIENAHKMGLGVNVWTVNDPAIMGILISHGVDYITTDDPIALRKKMIELSR